MSYNWNWSVFLNESPAVGLNYAQYLLQGAAWTLAVAILALIISLAAGCVVGVLRTTDNAYLAGCARAYVEIFRNVPLLVQLFVWYFVFPELLPTSVGSAIKQSPNAAFYTAVICLGLYTSPRIAEQLKSGIQSLGRGQRMAGLALGFSSWQTYRYVILPMAFRIVVPPLTSEFLGIIKNSAVAMTIGLLELTGAARSMQEFTFQTFEAFAAATVLYLIINIVVVGLMHVVEKHSSIPGYTALRPNAQAT